LLSTPCHFHALLRNLHHFHYILLSSYVHSKVALNFKFLPMKFAFPRFPIPATRPHVSF
jgi:hypothetical protein